MMATAEPPSSSSLLLPLLESLEDASAGQSDQTDAYLTIANRLSLDDGRQFLPSVEKHFSRLVKTILTHISSPNTELSQASLQALGFCLYHAHVARGVTAKSAEDILTALCSLVVKSSDKNTCIRALWVISKQNFPQQVVANKVSSILGTLENVWTREDIQSVVMEHEALNVIMRMLEQAPVMMGQSAVRWAKLILPLVVHIASKVRLRAAAALELGLPLLLEKQNEVACILEPLMSSKLIPELQKLFLSKNEANVLKLWPLFVKLLGKLLHKGGPFINSVLHLEEMGFRHSSPTIKKIAFIAWKSLIDNFALNPDILSNTKRMKLLMQPLNIHLRTEALQLTKVEVWWYLVVRLGPNLGPNFEQVSVPLLQCTIGADSSTVPGTPARASNQNSAVTPVAPKTGAANFNSPAPSTPRINLSMNTSSNSSTTAYPSIQLLGVEMLLHYFLGTEVVSMAARNKLVLSLEPLTHPFISGISSFTKHAAVFISNVRDGFISVGKDAPESLLTLIWKRLVSLVNSAVESVKKDRQACEVLTMMFQALQSIVSSEALPADRVLALVDLTVKGIPQRILGSATYQVGKMDVLNGTPALYLISLLYDSSLLPAYVEHERFFECLQALVDCGLSGPTSPLAFAEAVLGAMGRSAASLENKEHLWRMWSTVVGPLTDTITQTNEVNQGDALEHNFSAMHCALMFPVTHLLSGTTPLQQNTQKLMLTMWSKLYKAFARCSALVATAEENICCEELCKKMASAVDSRAIANPSTLDAVASILQVIIECVDFSPYSPQFQQMKKSPHTPLHWRTTKRNKALGNLFTYQALLVQCLDAYLSLEGPVASASEPTGSALISVMSTLFTNLALASTTREALASLNQPLTLFYKQASGEVPKFSSILLSKLEKLLGEVLGCLQTRSALAFDDDLLALLSPLLCVLFPHASKTLRTSVTQFWNATFAKSVSLTYPEELRPILCQVKLKTPIILPGFEANSLDIDDLGGQFSNESSQLETKLSGVKVSASAAKRGSLLARTMEQDRTPTKSKPVSHTKLDFGSPKLPFKKNLDEESNIDFVFIPPETKEERVLTEHQKEVKRTKRVDIPAMYNNLDASLDTTVFSQYTQSQEESSTDKLQTDGADSVAKEDPGKVQDEDMEKGESRDIVTEETQEYVSQEKITDDAALGVTANEKQETSVDLTPESAMDVSPEKVNTRDVSLEEVDTNVAAEGLDTTPKATTSPNVSGSSSDLVSDTPPKSNNNSRRQSFITLEKYADSKPAASPVDVTKFTGPLTKVSNTPEATAATSTSSLASPAATGMDAQLPDKTGETRETQESSPADVPPASSETSEVRDLSEVKPSSDRPRSQGTEDEDDVIPDTQAEPSAGPKKAAETSDSSLDDSQSSQVEPRRSGRATKPKHTDPDDDGEKRRQSRRRTGGEDSQGNSQNDSQLHGTRSRSKQQEMVNLRTRGQKNVAVESNSQPDSSQPRSARKRIALYSSSSEPLLLSGEEAPKRRSSRKLEKSESSDATTSSGSDIQQESQLERRRGSRPSRSTPEEMVAGRPGLRQARDQKDSSQTDVVTKTKRVGGVQIETSMDDSQTNSQADSQSSAASRASRRGKLVEALGGLMSAKRRKSGATADQPSLDNSEVFSPSSTATDSQSQYSTRRQTKAATPEEVAAKLKEDSSLETDNSQTLSQSTPTASHTRGRGRPRRDVVAEEGSNNSLTLTPAGGKESSQALEASQSSSGRYSTRRLSQALLAGKENSEVDSAEVREDTLTAKQQQSNKTSKDSLSPRSATRGSPESKVVAPDVRQSPSKEPSQLQNTPSETKTLGDPPNSPRNVEVIQRDEGMETERTVEVAAIIMATKPVVVMEKIETEDKFAHSRPAPKSRKALSHKSAQSPSKVKLSHDGTSSQGSAAGESQSPDDLKTISLIESEESSDLSVPPAQTPSPSDTVTPTEQAVLSASSPLAPMEQSSPPPASPATSASSQPDDTPPNLSSETDDKLSLQVSQSSSEEKDGESARCPVPESDTVRPAEEALTAQDRAAENAEEEAGGAECLSSLAEDKEDTKDASNEQQRLSECLSTSDELPEDEGPFTVIKESQSEEVGVEGECPAPLQETVAKPELQEPLAESVAAVQCDAGENAEEAQGEQDEETQIDLSHADAAVTTSNAVPSASASKEEVHHQDSPAKQKGLVEAVNGLPEAMESPCSSGRKARGTWSPSASPSTSILKKGQKRAMEEETPSPLVKSRRVSFANPIQHQELADDIDRRSPVVRTSSPKRAKTTSSSIVNKYITTPTKGPLLLSPRTLHSPTYKSSKKCLISEMSQEPRPIPKDCVFPALVACSAPVEAVLPQITSNMWPRGFGQLVRARNIKTVGDLSALTPSEIKTLPIRSPKISNVKKALRTYHEQQRKGQGGDELKSFDETEKMTSEPESSSPQKQEEDDKSTGEPLATELMEEPTAALSFEEPAKVEEEHVASVPNMKEEQALDRLSYDGQPVDLGALVSTVIPQQLGRCSDQQLVQLLMSVAREQQTRLEQRGFHA